MAFEPINENDTGGVEVECDSHPTEGRSSKLPGILFVWLVSVLLSMGAVPLF